MTEPTTESASAATDPHDPVLRSVIDGGPAAAVYAALVGLGYLANTPAGDEQAWMGPAARKALEAFGAPADVADDMRRLLAERRAKR